MNRWERPHRASTIPSRALPLTRPTPWGKIKAWMAAQSRTLVAADVISFIGLAIAMLVPTGVLTPTEAFKVTGDIGVLADMIETAVASVFGVVAFAGQVVRYLRQAIK